MIGLYGKANARMKNEIVWIVGNVTSVGTKEQNEYVVENGGVELLLEQLESLSQSESRSGNKARVCVDSLRSIMELVDYDNQDYIITKKCQMLNGK